MLTKLSAYLLPLSLLISISAFGQRPAPAQAERAPGAINDVSVASWMPFAELVPNGGTLGFGQSVSVSGNVAVVGSYGDSDGTGAAYVCVKSSDAPHSVTQTAKLTASDGQPGDAFGGAVSISGDLIIVGAPNVNNDQGKAYIFVKPKNGWTDMTETAQLTASDGEANDQFARAVSVSGSVASVGAFYHTVGSNAIQGAVYVFVEPPTGWAGMTQTAELTASDGVQNSQLGWSVAMAGNTVAAGANGVGGAVYVFVEPAGGWVNGTQTAKLTDPKDTGIGYSVGITTNAATIVAGSPFGGPDEDGAAHVYLRQGNTWQTTAKDATLLASDRTYGNGFGVSVATTGSTVLVGAPNAPCEGNLCRFPGTGIVYAYQEPPTGWKGMTQTQELSPSDGKPDGQFGASVAANGAAVIVGAPQTVTAYVYEYSANSGFTSFSVPGNTSTHASGINDSSQIVGYSNLGEGFLYAAGSFTTVMYPGSASTQASGINDDGEIVGWYGDSQDLTHGFSEISGVFTSIDFPDSAATFLTAVNGVGDIVRYYLDSSGESHGLLYSSGAFTNIDVPGAQRTLAFGINDSGVIAGDYCNANCFGFVDQDGVFTTVNYPGAVGGTAVYGINDTGDLVGSWGNNTSSGAFVFWSSIQRYQGFNLGGDPDTEATGINSSGEVSGSFCPLRGPNCYGFYGHLPGH